MTNLENFARDNFGLPVTILKKMPVTSQKCPWQFSKMKMSRAKKTLPERVSKRSDLSESCWAMIVHR